MRNHLRTILASLLCLTVLGLGACVDSEPMVDDASDDRSDVIANDHVISGHIAFFGVNDRINAPLPNFQLPSGTQDLYDFFGSRRGQVDLSHYDRLEALGLGKRIWGDCFKVTSISNRLHNGAIGFATWMCKLTLIKFERIVTGDLFVLGELQFAQDGKDIVKQPFGIVDEEDEDNFQIFRIHRNLRLAQFNSEGIIEVINAGLFEDTTIIVDRDEDEIQIVTSSDTDDGKVTQVFYQIAPQSFGKIQVEN